MNAQPVTPSKNVLTVLKALFSMMASAEDVAMAAKPVELMSVLCVKMGTT